MNKKGFTLIELLAVVIILGVIMTIAVPNVLSMLDRNKKDTFIENAKTMVTQAEYTLRSNTTGEDVATELETQRTYDDDSYVRGFLNDRNEGIYEPDKIMERDKEHGECDEKDVTVIDNDKDNDSHEHFEVNEEYIRVKAKDIIDGNEDIKEVFTEREVENLLKRRIEEQKEQKTVEEIIENTKQELEQETQHFRSRGF